jgi:hypothetical protein
MRRKREREKNDCAGEMMPKYIYMKTAQGKSLKAVEK